MKLPRVRFTVRRMMVAVAVFAVTVSLVSPSIQERLRRRCVEFSFVSYYHAFCRDGGDPTGYHAKMQAKYEWAARYPWLPVAPDAPEPE